MELLLVYLWLKLGAIKVLLSVILAVITTVMPTVFVFRRDMNAKERDAWDKHKSLRRSIFVSLVLLVTFLPSKTDVAILVGSSIAIDMKNSPEAEKVGTLLRQQANKLLDEAIKEKP